MPILSKRLCIFAVASHAEARIEMHNITDDQARTRVASHAEARIEIWSAFSVHSGTVMLPLMQRRELKF